MYCEKREVIEALYAYWCAYPDLRLGEYLIKVATFMTENSDPGPKIDMSMMDPTQQPLVEGQNDRRIKQFLFYLEDNKLHDILLTFSKRENNECNKDH